MLISLKRYFIQHTWVTRYIQQDKDGTKKKKNYLGKPLWTSETDMNRQHYNNKRKKINQSSYIPAQKTANEKFTITATLRIHVTADSASVHQWHNH